MEQIFVLLSCIGGIGWITYLAVRRVSNFTRTPMPLLWGVAMAPVFLWMGWLAWPPAKKQLPTSLFVLSFVISAIVYISLVQWGRKSSDGPPLDSVPPVSTAERSADPTATKALPKLPALEGPNSAVGLRGSLPLSLLPSPMPPLEREEEDRLRTCFPWSIYYLQTLECRPQAVICRGQLKSQPEVAYQTVRGNVEERFGDRFLVAFQEGIQGRPFFALVPNPYAAEPMETVRPLAKALRLQEPITRPGSALMLLGLTWVTALLAWPMLSQQAAPARLNLWNSQGVAYASVLLLVLGAQELAHYLMARRYQLKVTLPYFVPFPPVTWFPFGTLGAFSQVRSPIPNRRVLFDLSVVGPLASLVCLLPCLLWGLGHSQIVPAPNDGQSAWIQAFNPTFSLLITLLSKLALGGRWVNNTAIALHPVAVASCLGLVLLAFKLMPVGRLNGGQIVHAMFGQRVGALIGQVSRLLLLGLSLVQPHLRLWAVLFFLLPATDEPTLNDVTELDNRRDSWGLGVLLLLLLLILPPPSFLLRWLQL